MGVGGGPPAMKPRQDKTRQDRTRQEWYEPPTINTRWINRSIIYYLLSLFIRLPSLRGDCAVSGTYFCDRARLLEATVAPKVLYCFGMSVPFQSMEKGRRTVWRRMLPGVFRLHQERDEDWVDFVERSPQAVDSLRWERGYA